MLAFVPGSGSPSSSETCLSGPVESPETSSSTSSAGFVGGGLQSQRSVAGLAVVEERDEAMVGRMEDLEDNVERLNAIIKETEVCLLQVRFTKLQLFEV